MSISDRISDTLAWDTLTPAQWTHLITTMIERRLRAALATKRKQDKP